MFPNKPSSKEFPDPSKPKQQLESPFLDGELFADIEVETGDEWESAQAQNQLGPFQYAFEQEKQEGIVELLTELGEEELVSGAEEIDGFEMEEPRKDENLESGVSRVAFPSIKEWGKRYHRHQSWQGRVYGLVVHTTGSGATRKAMKEGISPTAWAVRHYKRSRGCHYVNGWRGIGGDDLIQIANERVRANGVGVTNKKDQRKDQRLSIQRGRFEKDLPPVLVTLWRKRWPGRRNSLELLPGTKTVNSAFIHVECPPCVWGSSDDRQTGATPMRPGLRFTRNQHDSIAHLAVDIARRNGWPPSETWWRTPRLLGHEDLTPISRHDKGGGWDPGYLREKPRFDWNYVYKTIEQILKHPRSTSTSISVIPSKSAISSVFSVLGAVARRFQEMVVSGHERLAVVTAYRQGVNTENKLTNLVFFARHPELGERRIRRDEHKLAREWRDIRDNVVRPKLQQLSNREVSLTVLDEQPIEWEMEENPDDENHVKGVIFEPEALSDYDKQVDQEFSESVCLAEFKNEESLEEELADESELNETFYYEGLDEGIDENEFDDDLVEVEKPSDEERLLSFEEEACGFGTADESDSEASSATEVVFLSGESPHVVTGFPEGKFENEESLEEELADESELDGTFYDEDLVEGIDENEFDEDLVEVEKPSDEERLLSFEEEACGFGTADETDSEASSATEVVFLSGESLHVVTGFSEGHKEDYWDPWGSGNPLLDTGPAQKKKELSDGFTVRELTSSGGVPADVARIDPKLVECLQKLREYVRKSVKITSGYRSWKKNVKVYEGRKNKDGTPKEPTLSRHCSGQAVDIRIAGMNGLEIGKAAIDAYGPNMGIGLGLDNAHIDIRGFSVAWRYSGVKLSWVIEIKRYQIKRGGIIRSKSPVGLARNRKPRLQVEGNSGAELVRFAQRVLNATEGERLDDDGVLGSLTRRSLRHFRIRYDLGSGGVLNAKTEIALAQRALEEISQQSLFAELGVFDSKTTRELSDFKSKHGLGSDATLDAATLVALTNALTQRSMRLRAPDSVPGSRSLTGTITSPSEVSKKVEFKPGGWGGWKGRQTKGTVSIDSSYIVDKYDLAVAVTAKVETNGSFDKVQMYDRGILSWGIKQWTMHRGSLQGMLRFIKITLDQSEQNSIWTKLFPGIDIQGDKIMINGTTYDTPEKANDKADLALRKVFRGTQSPKNFDKTMVEHWLVVFALAARHPKIQKLQFEYALMSLKKNLNRHLGKVLKARKKIKASEVHNYRRIGDYIENSTITITLFNGMHTQNPKWTFLYLKRVVDRFAKKYSGYDTSGWSAEWQKDFAHVLKKEFEESGVASWGRRALESKPHLEGRTSRTEKILKAYKTLSQFLENDEI